MLESRLAMNSKYVLRENLQKIRERVERAAKKSRRQPEEITLVAVSKTFPAEVIREAYDLGLRHFGENRVQEWEEKRGTLGDLAATWHLVGHLQSNKARRAAFLFHRIDSVDDLPLAKKLDAAAAAEGKLLPVLVEVHLGGEETKSGVAVKELPQLAESIAPFAHIDFAGLMTIPPYLDDPEQVRPYFARLRALGEEVSQQIGRRLPVLSMGMSHDFEIAIEEGATEIRVGSALFGERKVAG
jgi:PLP dependent protein